MKTEVEIINDSGKVELVTYNDMLKNEGVYRSELLYFYVISFGNGKDALYVDDSGCEMLNKVTWTGDKFIPVRETITVKFTG